MNLVLIALVSYLMGSVSISIMLSKYVFHTDVRDKGSGNAGATNVARVFGMKAGVLTLVGDAAKAALSMWIGYLLGGDTGEAVAGIGCIVGHCFPIYYHFRGGKGVSVGATIALLISWKVFAIAVLAFAIVVAATRFVSAGSLAAASAVGITSILFDVGTPKLILGVSAAVLVIFMHRKNIYRLVTHTEPKFKPKSVQ